MTKYKVSKSWFAATEGEILTKRDYCLENEKDVQVVVEYSIQDALDQGFIEPYEGNPKRWRANAKELWYGLLNTGEVYSDTEDGASIDNEHFESGNYFKSKETAESVAEALKLFFEYLHHDGIDEKWKEVQSAILDARELVLTDDREQND